MKLSVLVFSVFMAFKAWADKLPLNPTQAGLYDIGGFSLYLECYQNDKPQLILEQGFGRSGSDGVWLENILRLQQDFSVCLYDRAGLGKSEQGEVPFTVNDTAKRLHKLLKVAEIKAPYYFAGGSYASYIIKAFNHLYPQSVLGAVLIDPPPFGNFYTMGHRWPENFQTDNPQLQRYYAFEQSVFDPMFAKVPENVDHMKSYQQLTKASDFADKPLIIIRAKPKNTPYDPPYVPDDVAAVMDKLYEQAEQQFQELSTNSRVVYSTSEKHHLHIADRDLVVTSIQQLLDK